MILEMKNLRILCLILVISVVINDASPLNKKFILNKRHLIMGRLSHGLVPPITVDPKQARKIEESYFTQRVDNFDSSNTATYQQVNL